MNTSMPSRGLGSWTAVLPSWSRLGGKQRLLDRQPRLSSLGKDSTTTGGIKRHRYHSSCRSDARISFPLVSPQSFVSSPTASLFFRPSRVQHFRKYHQHSLPSFFSTATKSSSKTATKEAAASKKFPASVATESPSSSFSFVGILCTRLACAMGIVYVVTEYGIEWTVCDGPSMMPTVRPKGEIVLMDRLTPRLFGLSGGDTLAQRTRYAKEQQTEHVRKIRQRLQRNKERLLQIYQKEEEVLRNRRQLQRVEGTESGSKPQSPSETISKTRSTDDSSAMDPSVTKLEENPTSSTSDNANHPLVSSDNNQGCEEEEERVAIQRAAAQEYLKSLVPGNNDGRDDVNTWYETKIPVDRLPKEGAWDRFFHQISTPISVGDVVVLQHPNRIGTVCKRVVGLPGDIVTKPSSRLGAERVEELLYGHRDPNQEESTSRQRRQRNRRILRSGTRVPDGHIWVEGDNPWNSTDSRSYGPVPASLIMGRVLCRIWPLRGDAMLHRGDRPQDDETGRGRPSLAFSGSLVIPAGWEDQRIIKNYVRPPRDEDNTDNDNH